MHVTPPTKALNDYLRLLSSAEIDLPEAIATMTKVCIDEAVDALAAAYPAMFKPSMRCRPPHVNRDVVRNALFHGDVLRRLGVTDAQGINKITFFGFICFFFRLRVPTFPVGRGNAVVCRWSQPHFRILLAPTITHHAPALLARPRRRD